MKNLLMSPANHHPPKINQLVNTHSSGEPGCQCHLQVSLQAHQGRNQDEHFSDGPEHVPVLQGNKGSELSSWCCPLSAAQPRAAGPCLSTPRCPVLTGADAALMHFMFCILGGKEGIFSLQHSFSSHAQQSTALMGKELSF